MSGGGRNPNSHRFVVDAGERGAIGAGHNPQIEEHAVAFAAQRRAVAHARKLVS